MNPLACHDLSVSIAGRPVAQSLSLTLEPGQRLAILGRNGVGKTTLLHTLAGLRAPDAGQVELGGETYAALGPRRAAQWRGLLPQHQGDAFAATVLETVLIGRHPHLSRWEWEGEADRDLSAAALQAVGLAGMETREIHTLSGGERQRVALATLLVQQPQVYMLDEPLAHLDLNHQIAVLALMSRRVAETGSALVMVLHDINLALRFSDRALLLYGDGAHEEGSSDAVLEAARLTRLYGHPVCAMEAQGRRWFVPELSA